MSNKATNIILDSKSRKGGSVMNCSITLDWKSFVALGATALGIVCVCKFSPDASERVLTRVVDACKEYALAKSER